MMKKLDLKIKIEYPDYSDDEFSNSDLPPLISIFTGEQNEIVLTNILDETTFISVFRNYIKLLSGLIRPKRINILNSLA